MTYKPYLLAAFVLIAGSLIYPGNQSGQVIQSFPYINPFEAGIRSAYAALNDSSINAEAFQMAMIGHRSLQMKGLVNKKNIITIIDYTRPSNEKRFYVIDLGSGSVIFKSLVAHGRNSGELYADRFSNRPQSHQSALGFYITGSPYQGGQGYSLLMSGVDTGFNENARKRAVVIHGAHYATNQYVEQYGRLGRSFGCPALPPDQNKSIIELIKDGSVIFSYYPDENYVYHSKLLGYRTGNPAATSIL